MCPGYDRGNGRRDTYRPPILAETDDRSYRVDNLTHSLFALTLAGTGLGRVGRGATATLLVASNIPDIEVVTGLTGDRVAYLAAHRGPSHGPAALGLAVLTATVVWLIARAGRRRPDEAAGFAALAALAVAGVAGHVAMDFVTSYGTRILSPFSRTWFGVDWMPITDIGLIAILAGGLAATWWRPVERARVAAIVLALMAGDYAMRAGLHAAALSRASEMQRAEIGAPATTTSRPIIFSYMGLRHPAALPAALPTIGSPFTFRVILQTRIGFEVRTVKLLAGRDASGSGSALRFPNETGPSVDRAADAAMARVFLEFSRFPAAEVMRHLNGDLTVHWYDLRFAGPATPRGRDLRRHTSPFGAWVRLGRDGRIIAQGLGPG